jgi:hypothetical protein
MRWLRARRAVFTTASWDCRFHGGGFDRSESNIGERTRRNSFFRRYGVFYFQIGPWERLIELGAVRTGSQAEIVLGDRRKFRSRTEISSRFRDGTLRDAANRLSSLGTDYTSAIAMMATPFTVDVLVASRLTTPPMTRSIVWAAIRLAATTRKLAGRQRRTGGRM